MKKYSEFVFENINLDESPASMVMDIIRANSIKPLISKLETDSVENLAKEISNMSFKSKQKMWKQIRSFIRLERNPKLRKKLEDLWHKSHDYGGDNSSGIKYYH